MFEVELGEERAAVRIMVYVYEFPSPESVVLRLLGRKAQESAGRMQGLDIG